MFEFPVNFFDSDITFAGLSTQEINILRFERWWENKTDIKNKEIRKFFNFSVTRYYQILNRLIDNPKALEFDALLVKRLRRIRDG